MVDALVETIVYAFCREDLFGRPAINPPYGLPLEDAWWIDTGKAAKIRTAQGRK